MNTPQQIINNFFNQKYGIKKTSEWYKQWINHKRVPLYIQEVSDNEVSLLTSPLKPYEDNDENYFGAWIDIEDLITL